MFAKNMYRVSHIFEISAKSCEDATSILKRLKPSINTLRLTNSIWLYDSSIIEFFEILAKRPSIVHLQMDSFTIYPRNNILGNVPPLSITKLTVALSDLGVLTHMMRLITYPHTLVSLNITKTPVNAKAFKLLLSALQTNNTSLEDITFHNNDLSPENFSHLMHALGANTTVKTVSLIDNSDVFEWRDVYRLLYRNCTLVDMDFGDPNGMRFQRSLGRVSFLKSKIKSILMVHPTLENFSILIDTFNNENWVSAAHNRVRHNNNTRKAATFTSLLTRKRIKSRCFACSGMFKKLLQCSKCKRAFYCSKVCQTLHWRNHKIDCLPL